ncbi:MAG TPA: T9SS type A sorting domain-containing protein [Bacteroidia bacterium]|jgi:hypothetical protein
MKRNLLLLIAAVFIGFTSKAQVMNCGSFCILNINNIDTLSNELDVTVYNDDTNFVNYPIVVVVNSIGDTVANINNTFYFFGHPAGDTVVHTIPTTLDSIPVGFTGTVYFSDGLFDTTCSYSYPMACSVGLYEYAANNNSLSVYPNPASTTINICFGKSNSTAIISLYDASGRAVRNFTTTEKNISIDRGDLRSGIYFVNAIIGDQRLTKKIVLE